MLTRYMPTVQIRNLLIEKSRSLRKSSKTYSMFFYNDDTNTIIICTNRPGVWIGIAGTEVDNLKMQCRELIVKHNRHQTAEEFKIPENINISFIECEC